MSAQFLTNSSIPPFFSPGNGYFIPPSQDLSSPAVYAAGDCISDSPQISREAARVAAIAGEVIQEKIAKAEEVLANRCSNPSEWVLVLGDGFSVCYFIFALIIVLNPGLAAISGVAWATLTCGCIAGSINIGVALISLKEGIQALKNGDLKLGIRLLIDFLSLLAIGTIMILNSLAPFVGALSAIGAFFGANPWLLPVLFFIITIPVIVEIAHRIQKIHTAQDWASQLKEPLNELIQGVDPNNPFHWGGCLNIAREDASAATDKSIKTALAVKMEVLQADMGFKAAVESFKLFQLVLQKKRIEEQMTIVHKEIKKWNQIQYVRMFQQLLYTASFVVSMAGTKAQLNTPALNSAEQVALIGANIIPFGLDLCDPLKRNTPIVVPNVIPEERNSYQI